MLFIKLITASELEPSKFAVISSNIITLGSEKNVLIKKNTKIQSHSFICELVTIGENCFIGAGAVVVKDVPPNTVVVGNPAKIISTMDEKGEITKI